MARVIHGKITNQRGQPLKDIKVEAWDKDPDDDDWMAADHTDANGNYELHYRGGHWDPAPPAMTTWRPDIYVTANIKNNNGDWMTAAKSRVYKNHRLRRDLKVDLTITFEPIAKKRTAFQVSKYAFQFPNSFVVRDLLGIDGEWHMGLCGGMCAGALHRFNHGCTVPTRTTTPKKGDPLYNELFQRQLDTLAHGVLTKIITWTMSPDYPHLSLHSIRKRQKAEWPVVKGYIDRGKPVIVCLIREEGVFADITKNHQVLAIGYEYAPTPRDLKVEVYDPNDKRGSNFLILSLSGGRLGAHQMNSSGKRINFRGFFVLNTTTEASKKHYV